MAAGLSALAVGGGRVVAAEALATTLVGERCSLPMRVTIRPSGAERIREPPPRHRRAYSSLREQEGAPPLVSRRYCVDLGTFAKRLPRGAGATAPESAERPPS